MQASWTFRVEVSSDTSLSGKDDVTAFILIELRDSVIVSRKWGPPGMV